MTTTYVTDEGVNYSRMVFDYLYGFIVVFLFVNMITGIIINKFASMRNEADEIAKDQEKSCFICNKPRALLDTESKSGFEEHITVSTNINI